MPYDDKYRETPDYFGSEPTEILTEYVHLLDKARPILDIGAGQGRNTIYLARQGFTVDAVDPSKTGLDTIDRIAATENLPIRTYHTGIEDFIPQHGFYSGILVFGVIQVTSRSNASILVRIVREWMADSGLLLTVAFTTEDPSFPDVRAACRQVGKNSFVSAEGEYRTYLEPSEILDHFAGWQVLHHTEGLGPMHQHGNRPPHQHAQAIAVFRK